MQDLTGERQRESVGTSPRLCIVAQDRALRWTELTVALRQTLNPQDELKIIVDRRRSTRPPTEAPGPAERPNLERRRHPHVDVALNLDGFAIVPASASAHVETAPFPVETASRDAGEVHGTERRADDADPPRTGPPGSAARPRGARSASLEGLPRTPPRGETLDEPDVDDAEPQSHETEPPQRSDRSPRAPTRRIVNPSIQRIYPDEPRDGLLDDGRADDAGLSRPGTRPPQFSGLRMPAYRVPRPRTRTLSYRDEPLDDDESPRGSGWIWVVVGLVAAIGVLALILLGQGMEALKVGIDLPRPSFATGPGADAGSADPPTEPLTAPIEPASATRPEEPASLTPSPGADLADKTELEPGQSSPAPAPPPELPPRRSPRPTLEAKAEQTPETRSPARTSSAVRPQDAPMPRVDFIRSLPPRSPGSGMTYIVRISDTGGQPLVGAQASLVAHIKDGIRFSIPLDPGPAPGEYRATVPHDRALTDLRVRLRRGETQFVVPVER